MFIYIWFAEILTHLSSKASNVKPSPTLLINNFCLNIYLKIKVGYKGLIVTIMNLFFMILNFVKHFCKWIPQLLINCSFETSI